MTTEEKALLLTVARLLRARLKDTFEATGNSIDLADWNDIRDALAPFDPLPNIEAHDAARANNGFEDVDHSF